MSEYNVGEKFVIEIAEELDCSERHCNEEPHTLYRIKGFNSLVFDKNGLDKLERLDSDYVNENYGDLQDEAYEEGKRAGIEEGKTLGYEQGLNDGWFQAGNLATRSPKELDEMYFSSLTHALIEHTYQEATAKIEAYEKTKEEKKVIKVGDEVETLNCLNKGVVTLVRDKDFFVLWDNGVTYSYMENEVRKTGRTIDILTIFSKLKEK